MLLDKDR